MLATISVNERLLLMHLLKKFFTVVFLVSQINALHAMTRESSIIQVPTREQIKQIHETYYFYNRLAATYGVAVATNALYRYQNNSSQTPCSQSSMYDQMSYYAQVLTIPVILGCIARNWLLDYQYENRAFKPLLRAIEAEDERAVSAIVAADSVNMRSPLDGISPLRMATQKEKGKIVSMLLAKNAHREDEAVLDALERNNAAILALLLKAGCNANAKLMVGKYGHTFALHHAIRKQYRSCVELLLDAGAHYYRIFPEIKADGSAGPNAYQLAKDNCMEDLVTNYQSHE